MYNDAAQLTWLHWVCRDITIFPQCNVILLSHISVITKSLLILLTIKNCPKYALVFCNYGTTITHLVSLVGHLNEWISFCFYTTARCRRNRASSSRGKIFFLAVRIWAPWRRDTWKGESIVVDVWVELFK